MKKQKEDLESSLIPFKEQIKADQLVLDQENKKLNEQCKYFESCTKNGQELLRARDLQLSRVELEKTKIEADMTTKVKRIEADKSGEVYTVPNMMIKIMRSYTNETIDIQIVSRC